MFFAFLILAFAAVLLLLGWLLFRYFKSYSQVKGEMLVRCPETEAAAAVTLDARGAAWSLALGSAELDLKTCSQWPGRQYCGQQCLEQLAGHPQDCLVRNRICAWYEGKGCFFCGRTFSQIHWYDHRPELLGPDHELVQWSSIAAENIEKVKKDHQPVCWNCFHAELFRKMYPELVVDRPQQWRQFGSRD